MLYAVMVDMDQTLIEALDESSSRYKKSLGKLITYDSATDPDTGEKEDTTTRYTIKVNIRPNAVEMVRNIVGNGHSYILWSAGSYEYVHAVMSYFSSVAGVVPEVIYTRLDMVEHEGTMYKSMTSRGFSLREFLILEDNPRLVLPSERERVIRVSSWEFGDIDDTDMNFVTQLLQMYATVQAPTYTRSMMLVG